MQEDPVLGFLKVVMQVCGQPLALKKKKISSRYPICEKASQANETAERLCSWLESHPTRAVPWLPQAAD